jgi:hypothetical protein
MTISGAFFLPLELLVMLLPWRWVLMLAPVTTIFTATVVLVIGSFGIAPGLSMAAFIVVRTTAEICLGRVALPREMLPALTALGAFILVSILSLWLAVLFFQGHVLVLGGADGFRLAAASPYEFRRENVTQGCYLFLNAAFTLSIALQACRRRSDELATIIDRAIALMIVVAALLCVWQWLNYKFGLWWPKEIVATDPTHPDAGGQQMLDGLRVNGPFSEPSACASFFAGFLFYAWYRFLALRSSFWMLLTLCCIVIIVLSKATTGVAVLGLFVLLMAAGFAVTLLAGAAPRMRITWRGLAVTGLLFAAATAGLLYAVDNWDFISELFAKLVSEKTQGSSYVARSGANTMAVNILIETFGLGIGIGSHVASTVLLTLVSNTGILGALALAAFVALLFAPARGGTSFLPVHWFLVGIIAAFSFVGTTLNPTVIWLAFGLVLGARTSACIAARPEINDAAAWPERQASLSGRAGAY